MSSAFFLWVEADQEHEKPEVIRDPVEAVRKFLEAVETKESATLKWSA